MATLWVVHRRRRLDFVGRLWFTRCFLGGTSILPPVELALTCAFESTLCGRDGRRLPVRSGSGGSEFVAPSRTLRWL